jgi:3-oxocholest-4-en-26-oyl-CoA dehydrogenase alpha subunit
MRFEFTKDQIEWRDEVRDFLRVNVTPELKKERRELGPVVNGPLGKAFLKKVDKNGWLGIGWPKEYGGKGETMMKQFIFLEEFRVADAPWLGMTLTALTPTIMKVGSEEMKKEWIPKIVKGEVELALGYSEPDAGSDLAALTTEAVIEGDEFVINGQKTWNSEAHIATHEFLACRTDPDAPKHSGISIILVPIDYPGVTVVPIHTWGDIRTNEIFFDNVKVPLKNLVGELNEGWKYAMMALNLERFDIGSIADVRRMLIDVICFLKETTIDGEVLSKNIMIRQRVAELYAELEVCKWLCYAAAWMIDEGRMPTGKMLMVKIMGSELKTKFSDLGMQMMNLFGQLRQYSKWVPLHGELERLYRMSPTWRFGGGTNEILRDIIAQTELKLPREGTR